MRILFLFVLSLTLIGCSSTPQESKNTYTLAQYKQDRERERQRQIQNEIDNKCQAAKAVATGFTALTVFANVMASLSQGGNPVRGGFEGAKLANKEVWVRGVKYACP